MVLSRRTCRSKRLSRLYGVNHSIVSQTNPIALPFINEYKGRQTTWDILSRSAATTAREWSLAFARLAQKPLNKRFVLNRIINTYTSVVSQTYTGDINILPTNRSFNPLKLLSSRTTREMPGP